MIKSARIKFEKLLGETPRAFLLKINNKEHWIPKSQCRNFITNKKLGGNVILPTFILNEILECDINKVDCSHFIDKEYKVEHHKPNKVTFDPNEKPDESLIK